jgi:serine/threonine protein kinase
MECLEEPLPALAATLQGWAGEDDALQELDEPASSASRYARCFEELQVLVCDGQHRLTSCCNRESSQPHLVKATGVCIPALDVLQHVDVLRDLLTREGRLMARISHFAHILPLQGAWLEQRYVAAMEQQQESSSNADDWVTWSNSSSGWSHTVQGCSDGDSPLPLCVPWATSVPTGSRSNRSSSGNDSDNDDLLLDSSPDAVAEPKWPLYSSTTAAIPAADMCVQSPLVIKLTAYLAFPDCVPLSVWLQQQQYTSASEYNEYNELTRRQVLHIVLCVAQSLSDLHAQGLVHNAVHPGSVFIGVEESSIVYLGGLQNCATAGSRSTRYCSSTGNTDQYECYSSPEARCRLAIDSHSDTYALGVLYFELLLRLHYYSSSISSSDSSATDCESMIAATLRSASCDSAGDADTAAVVTAALTQFSGSSSSSSSSIRSSSSDSAAFSTESIELLLRLLARDSYDRCDAFEVVDELKEQLQALV